MGRRTFLVIECSFYDVCLFVGETTLIISESENFGGDVCYGTDTLRTDSVSEATLRADAGFGATTIDCGVNSDCNLG